MNYKYLLLLATSVLLIALPACGNKPVQEQKLYVINVLDKVEYDDCHIKGSINVAFDQVEQFAQGLNKETELVLYCSNYWCTGSGHAATQLAALGFTKVWAYEAGMAEWYQQGLPVEGACQSSYLAKKMEKPQHRQQVAEITTEALKEKMEQAGLL